MKVYLWAAGSKSGVTHDNRKRQQESALKRAQAAAARCIAAGDASSAEVHAADYVSTDRDAVYVALKSVWTGRLVGDQVTWTWEQAETAA